MKMRRFLTGWFGFTAVQLLLMQALAYPPGVGITSKSRSCTSCHINNGPWTDESKTIIDILDKNTRQSLKQPPSASGSPANGIFVIEVPRGQTRTVLTVIGRTAGDEAPVPVRNAWVYIDPTLINTSTISKFAPGWEVSLPMSCRLVGDTIAQFAGAKVTVLPMTIRPTDAARDAELELQVMLTRGESVKNKVKEGMEGNYFVRKVLLRVKEE